MRGPGTGMLVSPPTKEEIMNDVDEALASLRRKLCGDSLNLGVFFKDGTAHSFLNVDPDSLNFHDGFLTFKISRRKYVFPHVLYWTEDEV
jgi:hypothetical protein